MKTNCTATLFNKYVNPATRSEEWVSYLLGRVFWNNRKAANVLASGGQMSADQAAIFIPMSGRVMAEYLDPVAWSKLVSKVGHWTLQVGDLLVKGSISETLSGSYTVSKLEKDYPNVMVIASVDERDFGSLSMRHWQVGVK